MADEKVVTLLAEEGKKFKETGEAIASHGRCLVFLPKGATPGKQVRVRLQEIKADSRGRMMYRGLPAPIEYTERWKDNGDGTATRVTISTDWLGKQAEEGEVETRTLECREGAPAARQDRRIMWGPDLATSSIEVVKIRVFPLESEQVNGGTLVWVRTGERREADSPERLPILRVRVWAGDVDAHRLHVAYQDTWTLTADCFYTDSEFVRENTVWGKLPLWLQTEALAQYSVCICGRKRIAPNPDGYSKCEECRKEEVCVRCGKKTSVRNLAGRLVCDKCQPYEAAEQMIETALPRESREAIAAEAKLLLAGQALPQEAGEAILKATLDHFAPQWRKDNLIQKWAGYGWYHFCDEGIFATKFAPAALQILRFLPQATGNGLVEMVSWLGGGLKPSSGDFYLDTQVEGRSRVPPLDDGTLRSIAQRTAEGRAAAEFLRGSEPDRIAALAGYRNLVSKLGEESREAKAVAEILQAEKQDYAAALAKIREAERRLAIRQASIDAGEIWPDVTVRVSTESRVHTNVVALDADGSIVEPSGKDDTGGRRGRVSAYRYGDLPNSVLVLSHSRDDYGYRDSERWEVHHRPAEITPAQQGTVKRLEEETRHYFTGPGTGWDLSRVGPVTFSTAYHRDFAGEEAELDSAMRSSLPIDVSLWETEVDDSGEYESIVVGPYRRTTPEGKEVRAAEREVEELTAAYAWLVQEKERAAAALAKAEEEFLVRADVEPGTARVENGTVFEVEGFELRQSPQGPRLEYGPCYDRPSGNNVYLVLDPYSGASEQVAEGQRALVKVRPRSGSQLELFQASMRPKGGGPKQRTFGYFVTALVDPRVYDSQIEEAEGKLAAGQAKLAEVQARAARAASRKPAGSTELIPGSTGFGSYGTMAEAFRKAMDEKNKK